MRNDTEIVYELRLKPLRFSPVLAESMLYGLKWSLGAMFADPFPIRDVIVAARELIDNILIHADWERSPAPFFSVRYGVRKGLSRFCISSSNVAKDIDEAKNAVSFIDACTSNKYSQLVLCELTARLSESTSLETIGGVGLLQVASSPSSHLRVHLEGLSFHVRVEIEVPELQPALKG